MKALSIWQPWASAIIATLPTESIPPRNWRWKRVENRAWSGRSPAFTQARALIGTPILIHAAARYVRRDFDETMDGVVRTINPAPGPEGLAFLAALGVELQVQLRGVRQYGGVWTPLPSMPFGAIVGRMTIASIRRNTSADQAVDPWAIPEQIGLRLYQVHRLVKPIPYRGAQGFFDVPTAALDGAQFEPVRP